MIEINIKYYSYYDLNNLINVNYINNINHENIKVDKNHIPLTTSDINTIWQKSIIY